MVRDSAVESMERCGCDLNMAASEWQQYGCRAFRCSHVGQHSRQLSCGSMFLMEGEMENFNMFGDEYPNVIGGARCGEAWPEPSSSRHGDESVVSYINISKNGVLELYLWDPAVSRWTHRVSTTKEKLIDEFKRRNDEPPHGGREVSNE